MISAIVAMAHKNVIGTRNEIPWYLPADFKHFRTITAGHPVIMGRRTADSIIERNGQPLPGRENIVITHDESYKPEGFFVVHSIADALRHVKDKDTFIIGGQQIYSQAFPYLDRLYITEVDAEVGGDTFFPEVDPTQWREVEREHHEKDSKNQYNYSYVTLDRIAAAPHVAK